MLINNIIATYTVKNQFDIHKMPFNIRVDISGARMYMVYSVPAVLLVDCDSPADMLCVVSSCSVAGCWPVFLSSFPSSFLSLSCLISSLSGSILLAWAYLQSDHKLSITTLLLLIFVQLLWEGRHF